MTQQEHLQLIRAKCVALLELAKQRTPGRWHRELLDQGYRADVWAKVETGHQVVSAHDWNPEGDSAFIASAAGPFEAALESTIVMIDMLDDMPCTVADRIEDHILDAWPLELL